MPQRGEQNYYPVYKVRQFIQRLRENCLKIEPEERHSVDEMIIPTKTRWGIKQYNPKKHSKWGGSSKITIFRPTSDIRATT